MKNTFHTEYVFIKNVSDTAMKLRYICVTWFLVCKNNLRSKVSKGFVLSFSVDITCDGLNDPIILNNNTNKMVQGF